MALAATYDYLLLLHILYFFHLQIFFHTPFANQFQRLKNHMARFVVAATPLLILQSV